MMETIHTPRPELSPFAPRILQFSINPDKIREVIGSGGKTINGIIAETGVKIDIEDDGRVFIASTDAASRMASAGATTITTAMRISAGPSFFPRYSGERPIIKLATNTASTVKPSRPTNRADTAADHICFLPNHTDNHVPVVISTAIPTSG